MANVGIEGKQLWLSEGSGERKGDRLLFIAR